MKYITLNSRKTKKALLIHGLYSSSGYWLEYIKYFKNYKLLVLDIDYFSGLSLQTKIDKINLLINTEFEGEVDIIISHSFGTLVANGIFSSTFKYSFEICPVHSSKRLDRENFIDEIHNKLKNKMTYEEIKLQSELTNNILSIHKLNIEPASNRILLYPNNDKFFIYDINSNYQIKYFKGDHFNIEDSLKLIFTIL